jgi:hypothetical protein
MNKVLLIVGILLPSWGFAQQFPDVFAGTWRDSISCIYETWEKAGDKYLKGYSYEIKDGEKRISEYIEIKMQGNNFVYTVSVKNQNNEMPVSFELSPADSIYTFVNPDHDFPTYIIYTVVSRDYIRAKVGNNQRSFTLNYHRID